MARKQFPPASVFAGTRVRYDTAAGSNTPADLQLADGTSVVGAVLTADAAGRLPAVLGPDGTTVLYRKQLDTSGTAVGQAVAHVAYDLTSTAARNALSLDGGTP